MRVTPSMIISGQKLFIYVMTILKQYNVIMYLIINEFSVQNIRTNLKKSLPQI